MDQQETGILFFEVCVKLAKRHGRIAIILPNGYLGNRSIKYYVLREWLLRHCRIVSICSFPRFTFKSSGADVSASVVFLQKREHPLTSARSDDKYYFNVEMIETVGWNVGNKRGEPIYRRNPEDGSFLTDNEGNKVLDADFDRALMNIKNSILADSYQWLSDNISRNKNGWVVSIKNVLQDSTNTIDPKRYCRKFLSLQKAIKADSNLELGDVLNPIPESFTSEGNKIAKKNN